MNPLVYLVAALVILVAGFGSGFHVGANEQKVSDQVQFDAVEQKLTDQKAEANAQYRKDQDANLALATERDNLKTTLEKEHETNRIATDTLRNKYAVASLRFSAGQSSGLGGSCRGAQSAGIDPASPSAAPVVQLPDEIAASLRQIVFDADTLADSYRECYGYAQQVK